MKKQMRIWSMIMLVVMALPMMVACGSDSEDDYDATIIPSGTYVEENGREKELYTLVVEGSSLKITVTEYGKVTRVYSGTYRIKKDTIYITMSEGTESGYFSMSGNRVTIGEITYIRQI